MSPAEWAIALLQRRVSDATDAVRSTYAGEQRLAIHGRKLLAISPWIDPSDYPVDADDDFRELAAAAYTEIRALWFAGRGDDELHASAVRVVDELRADWDAWADEHGDMLPFASGGAA